MRKLDRFVLISRDGIFQEVTKMKIITFEEGKNDFIEEGNI
jgi:hypothetical protein